MKWFLIISVTLNVFLIFKLSSNPAKQVETAPKVIVKKAPSKVIERKVYVEVPVEKKKATEASGPTGRMIEFDEKDMEDVVARVNQDREDFLIGELGLTPTDYEKIEAVKNRYIKRYQEILPKDHYGDLTLEQRQALLNLDMEREEDFARTMGEAKWQKFQKFRNDYNQKMFSKGMESGIILPMEI